MSAWSHLPNAQHIDRVLASVKKHPDIWDAAYDAAQAAARDEAWFAAHDASHDAAYDAAWDAAWFAVWDVARDAVRSAALEAARAAILALIAYDDCDQYLVMSSEQLRVWAILTERPAAILLLPAVVAFERIAELETV